MDFFSAVVDPSQPIIHNDRPTDNANDSFAEAIASRFGSSALLTTRLTPVTLAPPPLRLPNSPMANMSIVAPPPPRSTPQSASHSQSPVFPSQFTAVTTVIIDTWIDDQTALILDIRPHAAYSTTRVPRAVSLSVPSTLLKRPLFSLHRLADMLPSANARARFSSWRSASRILVYDADSAVILESSNIYGLLRKFKNDGFQGELAWLKGGFQSVWREKHSIIDARPPTPDPENDDDDDDTAKSSPTQTQSTVLRTRHLPMAAFSLSSIAVAASPSSNPKRGPLARGATFPTLPTPSQILPQPAFNPFFDAVRQNIELSQGITERIPLRLPRRVRHRIHELPFPWLREIARHAAKLTPRNRPGIDTSSSTSEESEDNENTTSADIEDGKQALAMQFFKIEVAEQRRLMGIMDYHAKETAIVTVDTDATPASSFPYSITAGVEKGAKNRYRHIWPFEHARVRLHQRRETDDDYVNASYVQPLGTNKRYIATQGPLAATFTDFWTLCWEQNVHVIVMLTREVENSMAKCGSYWVDNVYGPLRLRLISATGVSPSSEESRSLLPRSIPQRNSTPLARLHHHRPSEHLPHHRTHRDGILRRVFELTHTGYPEAEPRKIIHLQYLEWPDMNVPDDPRGILGLMKEMDEAVQETESTEEEGSATSTSPPLSKSRMEIDETTGIAKHALGKNRPVLLHCSAGVGRTGGFIAIDAVLSAIRRQLGNGVRKSPEVKSDDDAMDVDVPSGSTPAPALVSSVAAEQDDNVMSVQDPVVDTASVSITAGNRHRGESSGRVVVHFPVVPIPSPPSTEPDASGSEREIVFGERAPSNPVLTTHTREWAEDVCRAEGTTISTSTANQRQRQPGTSESGVDPSSTTEIQIPSESSSSSGNSQLDLLDTNGNPNPSGIYHFSQTSSLETSISGDVSLSPVRSPSVDAPPVFVSIDRLPGKSVEAFSPSRTQADHDLELHPPSTSNYPGDQAIPQKTSDWLGEGFQRNSLSPMPHATSGENNSISDKSQHDHTAQPLFTLHAPQLSGAISSDAEPPSRSLSPSADEGSVANQVSSYHSHLKNHHHPPSHHNSLPITLDNGKSARKNIRAYPLDRGRLTSPAPLLSAPIPLNSGPTSAVDYKEPRPLHGAETPPYLTSFEEPICEVIQDMREQRMSLCQSLRQYVFVHAAIIEGALMIVDEEKELTKERERGGKVEMSGLRSPDMELEKFESLGEVAPQGAGSNGTDGDNTRQEGKLNVPPNTGDSRLGASGTSWDFSPPTIQHQYTSTMEGGSEGYFSNIGDYPSVSGGSVGDMGGIVTGIDPFKLKLPGGPGFSLPTPTLQRPRHLSNETLFNRGTNPPDFLKDGLAPFVDDHFLLKRPSFKRKQPSGESIDVGTTRNKRTQSENSSREREREREREKERESERMSSGSPQTKDSAFDALAPGFVR